MYPKPCSIYIRGIVSRGDLCLVRFMVQSFTSVSGIQLLTGFPCEAYAKF